MVTSFFVDDEMSTLDLGNGYSGDVTAKLAGKIRAGTGSGTGTLQVDMAVKGGSRRQVDTCSTGRLPVGWKVKLADIPISFLVKPHGRSLAHTVGFGKSLYH